MELRTRKNIRLQGYDYSQNGAYFITVCVKDRHHLLWEDNGRTQFAPTTTGEPPQLSHIGETIDNEIKKIPQIYENVDIDKYVIMPNHLHMIVLIDGLVKNDERIAREIPVVGANCVRPPCSSEKETPSISRIVKQFKGSI